MDYEELERARKCAQYLALGHNQAGLGGGAQMEHIVMAMQDLLAMGVGRDWALGITQRETHQFLSEAGRKWLEENGPDQRGAYRQQVLSIDLVLLGNQELQSDDQKGARRILNRLLESYDLDNMGRGIAMTDITLAEYGLLSLGVDLDLAVSVASEALDLRLETLACEWEESHPPYNREPYRDRAKLRLQWALDLKHARIKGR